MKKFLVVLLSLGLIAAFAAMASAASTATFAGSYYVTGTYSNNPNVSSDDTRTSRSGFFSQTRLIPKFTVADGLSLNMRIDFLEKLWGVENDPNYDTAQENIDIDLSWVSFQTAIGKFDVGYMSGPYSFGTTFMNNGTSQPGINYTTQMGPVSFLLGYEKGYENIRADKFVVASTGKVDADDDAYRMAAVYKGKGIEAGMMYKYFVMNQNRVIGSGGKYATLNPYVKATFGPLYVEGELDYMWGKKSINEAPAAVTPDVDIEQWGAYVSGTMTFGPAKVGALFAYTSGDDFQDATKSKSGMLGGDGFQPTLILLNKPYRDVQATSLAASGPTAAGGTNKTTIKKFNTIWYGLFGSYSVTPKLDLGAAFNYATVADKHLTKTTSADSDKLGYELDVTATYKIYDNLSYMVGAGYLWTGDYYKLATPATQIGNDYMLMNKLELTF